MNQIWLPLDWQCDQTQTGPVLSYTSNICLRRWDFMILFEMDPITSRLLTYIWSLEDHVSLISAEYESNLTALRLAMWPNSNRTCFELYKQYMSSSVRFHDTFWDGPYHFQTADIYLIIRRSCQPNISRIWIKSDCPETGNVTKLKPDLFWVIHAIYDFICEISWYFLRWILSLPDC